MRFFLIKITSVILFFSLLVSCGRESKRRGMARDTIISTLQSNSEIMPYDSIYVKKMSKNKDSLIFYKNKESVGSAIIVYE